MNNSTNQISIWEKLRAISAIIASVIIPIAVALTGNWYSNALKDKEIQVKYVELAVDILSQEPTDKNLLVRKWAVDLINNYSVIKIGAETQEELLRERIREPHPHLEEILKQISDNPNQTAKDIIDSIGR